MKNTTAYLLRWAEKHISRMMTWGGRIGHILHIEVGGLQYQMLT